MDDEETQRLRQWRNEGDMDEREFLNYQAARYEASKQKAERIRKDFLACCRAYSLDGWTDQEIAEVTGHTRQRISQILYVPDYDPFSW